MPLASSHLIAVEQLPLSFSDPCPGNYKAEEWLPQLETYAQPNSAFKLRITVDEVFDNHQSVVKQSGAAAGRFTFTAAEAGEHRICIMPSRAVAGGVRVGPHHSQYHVGTVKLTLDLAIGQTSKIERTDKGKMQDITGRVKDLRSRLEDIRKEQVFQRVCRANWVVDRVRDALAHQLR